MTVTDQEIRAIAFLAKACRPTGAARWDEAGIVAAIAKVRDRQLATVAMAVIRAASDRDVESPGVIPSNGSHWAESAAVASYIPNVIPPAERCGICNKARQKCQTDPRHADDDHVFDDGRRNEFDLPRVVADLKAQVVPVAPPTAPKTLDEVCADPKVQAVRDALNLGVTVKREEAAMSETTNGGGL